MRHTIKICKTIITHYHFRFGSTTSSSYQKYLYLWLETVFPSLNGGDWNDKMFLFSLLDRCKSSKGAVRAVQDSLSQLNPEELKDSDGEFVLMMHLYFFARASEDVLLQWVNQLPPFKESPARDFQTGWTDGHRLYDIVHSLLPQSDAILNLSSLSNNEIIEEALARARNELSISSHFPASVICCVDGDQFPLILFLFQLQAASGKVEHPTIVQTSSHTEVKLVHELKDGIVYSVGKPIAIELSTPNTDSGVLRASLTMPVASQFNSSLQPDIPLKATTADTLPLATVECSPQPPPSSPVKMTTSSRTSPLATVEWSSQPFTSPVEKDTTALLASAEQCSDSDASSPLHLESMEDASFKADRVSSISPLVTVEESSSLVTVEKVEPHLYRVSFTPQMEGLHQLSLFFDNQEVFPAPLSFECLQMLANRCFIKELEDTRASAENAAINDPFEVKVDCCNAGRGRLTPFVTPDIKDNDVFCSDDTNGCYCVRLTPRVAGDYTLQLYWNDESIPNSPLAIHVWDPSSSSFMVDGPGAREHAVVGWPSDFDITVPRAAGSSDSSPVVEITCDAKKLEDVQVFPLKSDSEKCTYRYNNVS